MTRRASRSYIFACVIISTGFLTATYTGNPWAGITPGILFVFVVFPRWRRTVVRLIEQLIHLAAKMQKGTPNDRCDPE